MASRHAPLTNASTLNATAPDLRTSFLGNADGSALPESSAWQSGHRSRSPVNDTPHLPHRFIARPP